MAGRVELFVPERDPTAQARVPRFAAQMDRPIAAPALKAAGAQVTVVSRKTYEAEKKKEAERKNKEAEGPRSGSHGDPCRAVRRLFGDIGEKTCL